MCETGKLDVFFFTLMFTSAVRDITGLDDEKSVMAGRAVIFWFIYLLCDFLCRCIVFYE